MDSKMKVHFISQQTLLDHPISRDQLKEILQTSSSSNTLILGSTDFNEISFSSLSHFPSAVSYGFHLCRKLKLLKNDRILFCPLEDVFTKIDLALSRHNKKELGDGETDLSDVLNIFDIVKSLKLNPNSFQTDSEKSKSVNRKIGDTFVRQLKESNLVDQFDVFNLLKKSKPEMDLPEESSGLVILPQHHNAKSMEFEFLKLLFPGNNLNFKIEPEKNSLDGIFKSQLRTEPIENVDEFLAEFFSGPCQTRNTTSKSYEFCQELVLGYLRLLVNSRDEISVARIISGPCGVLNHKAFHLIREEADKTRMPLYQTIVSYVRKLSLGGKSYAPTECHVLFDYNKELEEFVNLMEKLQTKIEDEKKSKIAIEKVFGHLKFCVKKSPLLLKSDQVDRVFDEMSNLAEKMASLAEEAEKSGGNNFLQSTPGRKVGNGGSVVGRDTIKVIRQIVDIYSTRNESFNVHRLLGKISDCENIQDEEGKNTPSLKNIPKISKLYDTPISNSEDNEISLKSKLFGQTEEVMKSNQIVPKKKKGLPFGCSYSWAPETSPIVIQTQQREEEENFSPKDFSSTSSHISTPLGRRRTKKFESNKELDDDEIDDEKIKKLVAEVDACMARPELKQAQENVEHAFENLKKFAKTAPKRKSAPKRSILQEISNMKKQNPDFHKPKKFDEENKKNVEENNLDILLKEDEEERKGKKMKLSSRNNCDKENATKQKEKKIKEPKKKKESNLIKGQTKMTTFFRI